MREIGDKRRGMTFTSSSSPYTSEQQFSLSFSFVYLGCTCSLRILASYSFYLSLPLSLSLQLVCQCVLSKCFHNERFVGVSVFTALKERERDQANEKCISLKTPLPFPWPLQCIYNPSFAASEVKYVTFTSFFPPLLSAR